MMKSKWGGALGAVVLSVSVISPAKADKVIRTATLNIEYHGSPDLAFNGIDLAYVGAVKKKDGPYGWVYDISTEMFKQTPEGEWQRQNVITPSLTNLRFYSNTWPWVSMTADRMIVAGAGDDDGYEKQAGTWKRIPVFDKERTVKKEIGGTVIAGITYPFNETSVWIAEQNNGGQWEAAAEFNGGQGKTAEIAIAKNRIAFANADYATDGLDKAGRVLILARVDGQWQQEASITAPVPVAGAAFGWAIDFNDDGSEILISAPTEGEVPETRGKVYLYHYDEQEKAWNHTATFQVTDRKTLDMPKYATRFGETVALDGDIAVVGTQTDYQAVEQVNIYLRENGTWDLEEIPIKDVSGAGVDAVAVSGDNIAITGYDRGHFDSRIILMKRVPDGYADNQSDNTANHSQPASVEGQGGQRGAPDTTGQSAGGGGGAAGLGVLVAGMLGSRRRSAKKKA